MSETPNDRIERARLRQRIADEVIGWCRSAATADPRTAAVELHTAHARHARAFGNEEMALLAEARLARAR